MKRLFVTSRLDFKTLAPDRDFLPLPELLDHARAEKDEVITERGDEGEPIRVRLGRKGEKEKRRIRPGDPFDLQRQNKEDVNDFVGIKMGESEKESREQHLV